MDQILSLIFVNLKFCAHTHTRMDPDESAALQLSADFLSCKQDGMCNVYEQRWDHTKRKFFCSRLPDTEWCSCSPATSIHPCRNHFLCQRLEVPACILTENQGRCQACADHGIFMQQREPMPRPCAHWECPGCRMHKRQVGIHPVCSIQHSYCLECLRNMLLLSKDASNRATCPLCRPLFDMGKT